VNVLNTLSSSLWTENACSDILQLLQSHQESHISTSASALSEKGKKGEYCRKKEEEKEKKKKKSKKVGHY